MKKNKIFVGILAMSALLMLSSCTNEEIATSNVSQLEGNASTIVKFKLNGNQSSATTRAESNEEGTDIEGLTNEKTIDALYAVVFKDGKFYKIYKTELMDQSIDANKDYYTFDMGAGGAYIMYLIANPGNDLVTLDGDGNINGGSIFALDDTKEAADYFKLTSSQTPGDNKDATRSLMTSNAIYVGVEASNPNGTDVTPAEGYVAMTRAAARIDIDTRKLTNTAVTFKIKEVIVHNRYPKTVINRGLVTDMTLPTDVSADKQSDYTYSTISAPATGDDLSGAFSFKSAVDPTDPDDPTLPLDDKHTTRILSPNIWDGIVYTYENMTKITNYSDMETPAAAIAAGLTVVEIVGDLNGIEVKQNVIFALKKSDTEAEEIPIERNHLYSIELLQKEVPTDYAPFLANITVLDYRTGEKVVYTSANLTDQENKPNFKVTDVDSGTLKDGDDNTVTTSYDNPAKLELSNAAHTIKLTVTSVQSSARLVLVDKTDDTEAASKGLESIKQESYTASDIDGKVTQVYEVKIKANDTAGDPARTFQFRVENALGWNEEPAYRTFTIEQAAAPAVVP